jgi:hypothetical protein
MNDDSFDQLAAFRAEVPLPDEETVRRIYGLATEPCAGRPLRVRSSFARPPRFVLTAAIVCLVLVPAALAFGGKVVDLFEGTPAPPPISSFFATNKRLADTVTQRAFATNFPQADVTKAHGVIRIQTPDGPQELWAAPNDQGGLCWFIDFANDPAPNGVQPGFGTCDTSASAESTSNITFEGPAWELSHPLLYTVDGRVYVDAATVQVTFADGSRVSLPVVEGLFLGSLDRDGKVTEVTAYDEAGAEVARRSMP